MCLSSLVYFQFCSEQLRNSVKNSTKPAAMKKMKLTTLTFQQSSVDYVRSCMETAFSVIMSRMFCFCED